MANPSVEVQVERISRRKARSQSFGYIGLGAAMEFFAIVIFNLGGGPKSLGDRLLAATVMLFSVALFLAGLRLARDAQQEHGRS